MWISHSGTFSRRPGTDGFSRFTDTPILSCSRDFNTPGDWPSEVPAYALPHFFPYPLPLSLWSLSCSTLISLPAVFPSCGALSWKEALAGHFQELTGLPFQPLHTWPGHPALSCSHRSNPSVCFTCWCETVLPPSCPGHTCGCSGAPLHSGRYITSLCPVHTDPTPQGLCPAGVQPYPPVLQAVAPSFVIDSIYEYFSFKCLFLNSFNIAIIILLHVNISNLFFKNEK